MNQKIKDLLHKTGVHDNWNDADWYSLSPGMLGEFAELIVKECISYIDSRDYHSGSEGIAEHFGVQE